MIKWAATPKKIPAINAQFIAIPLQDETHTRGDDTHYTHR
jgi:hypothetical protein